MGMPELPALWDEVELECVFLKLWDRSTAYNYSKYDTASSSSLFPPTRRSFIVLSRWTTSKSCTHGTRGKRIGGGDGR